MDAQGQFSPGKGGRGLTQIQATLKAAALGVSTLSKRTRHTFAVWFDPYSSHTRTGHTLVHAYQVTTLATRIPRIPFQTRLEAAVFYF